MVIEKKKERKKKLYPTADVCEKRVFVFGISRKEFKVLFLSSLFVAGVLHIFIGLRVFSLSRKIGEEWDIDGRRPSR